MKILLVAAFLVAGALSASITDEQKMKLAEYHNNCVTSSGVTSEVLANAKRGVFPQDPNLKKYFGCVFKLVGFLKDNGDIDQNVMKAKMPKDVSQEDAAKVFKNCINQKGANPDETAFLLYKCYWETTPNHISFGL